MFIVLEGTDASGKTSLTEAVKHELAERFPDTPVETFHKGKPEELTRRWVLNDYVLSIENENTFKQICLSDRWHWGEITYAPKFRPDTNKDGYGLLGQAGWRWAELFMASRGIAQFWLYQPLEVVERRLAARGDDFVDVSDLSDILSQYHIARRVSIGTTMLSPDAESLDELPALATQIVDRAVAVSEQAEKLQHFPGYVGVPNPRALLIGDRHNETKRYGKETDLAFMPVDGNSAEYLLTSLPDSFWKEVGIINVNDQPFGAVRKLWEALGNPPVVALGRLAEKGLAKQGFTEDEYSVLPHPQWVRRFANSKKMEYGQAIARLATTKDKEDEWILR
jgi:hypothetical protein